MFSNDSTENLLDNLESELTEMIELDTPKSKNPPKKQTKKISSPKTPPKEVLTVKKREPPPVPARRNISKSPLTPLMPVPATRNQSSLDKIEKNNENEIIQLQSLNSELESISSGSQRNSQASSKHNTVISINEKKTNNIRVIHEAEKMPDDVNETFFVIKHGKWAEGDDDSQTTPKNTHEVIEVEQPKVIPSQKSTEIPSTDEKPVKKKKIVKKKKESTTTTSATTSLTSSSSDSSSESELPLPKKKSRKSKTKARKKSTKKASDNQTVTSCTEATVSKKETEKLEMTSTDKAIGKFTVKTHTCQYFLFRVNNGFTLNLLAAFIDIIRIYVNNTGPMKYRKELKGLRIKISFYNEDNGKQIGDAMWTKHAGYNNDFYNFVCFWNENLRASFDLKRLREIYNNFLIFFEVINGDNTPVCWAFIKLFSQNFANIDKKFKLQFYEYQVPTQSCFQGIFSNKRKNFGENISIFDQWQMTRRKFPSVLNVSINDISLNEECEEVDLKEEVKVNRIQVLSASEASQRHWRKIPGQACKVPNKIFQKILLQDKGALNVKFSHDGNYLAFTDVSKNGHLLYVYKFPEMKQSFIMLEHSELIHDLDWKKQKQYSHNYLVSASADFTAIVWDIKEDSYTYSILPHPSFVYAAKFLQSDESDCIRVVTACRDNYIRIWKNRPGLESFELCQELKHPKISTFTYITSIATRNSDVFYSSSSTGDIVEWAHNDHNEYSLNRHFKIEETRGRIVNSMELNPRGNKICFRMQDCHNFEVSNAIYVLGIATGTLTQKFNQLNVQAESQGRLRITPCGTQIYTTNGPIVRHYQMINGNIVAVEGNKNSLNVNFSLGDKGFISSMDYHPKDFFLACGIYGARPGGIAIFSYETNDKDPIEIMKMGSQEMILQKSLEAKQIGSYSDIIKRLDEVFLAPTVNPCDGSQILKVQECNYTGEENTFTIPSNSKRSKTYTVSQGPATFTIQKGGTYEIQKNDGSDEDETTISESLN